MKTTAVFYLQHKILVLLQILLIFPLVPVLRVYLGNMFHTVKFPTYLSMWNFSQGSYFAPFLSILYKHACLENVFYPLSSIMK